MGQNGFKEDSLMLTCNYCKERGHWKAECPAIRAKIKRFGDVRVKPTTLAASIQTVPGSA